jgi:hypothetical protein
MVDPAGVTLIIPTVAGRQSLLERALASVACQTRRPDMVLIEPDPDRSGPGPTRNRALYRTVTEWVAFLDDDDELLPGHLRVLMRAAALSGADVLYPQFQDVGHVPEARRVPQGLAFDPGLLGRANFIPITVLARTRLIREVGAFADPAAAPRRDGQPQEDWGLWLRLLAARARFQPVPQVTWRWHHHPGQHQGHPAGHPGEGS